ncbi:MAG: stage II sporulation protein M [Oscillospiraceae bacterium]|nr:stage II sporulation protein M [Oscillospiraceae bacterium]
MKFIENIKSDRRNNALYVLVLILLTAGVSAGSVYLARRGGDMGDGITEYIGNFLSSFSENRNNMAVFKNSLTANLIYTGIIFAMGFFRLGCVVTGAIIVRKGFVMGFTAASFFKFYGLNGMLIMLSTMPTVLITIPALLFFSAVSVKFSLNPDKKQKN